MARYPQSILVSCEIPWDKNEQLLEDVFRREIRHILAHFSHLYIFGTAGEGYAVDMPQFRQIVTVFHEETQSGDVYPMVGVIDLSTARIVERIGYAYDVGFRVFQISLPSWGVLNDRELLTFFQDVCSSFPEASFLHYNLPRSGRVLEAPDYRRLVEAVPNLVATKNTGGGMARAAALMMEAPELQHYFGEANFAHGCQYGECSLLASAGPMAPHLAWTYFEAGCTRQNEVLFRMQREYHDLMRILWGPLRSEARIDGAYDKILVRLGGFEEMPLRLLSPYEGFTEAEYMACKERLRQGYPEWPTVG